MRMSIIGIVLILLAVHAGTVEEPLVFVRAIDLPGVEGRIDHLAFDPTTGRLYVAALGNNTVEVLDANAASHIRSLPGFREPQGVAVVPDMRSVAVANGQGEGIQLMSADDYRPGAVIRLGDDADNVRYDAPAKRVYVGYGSALAAIDPTTARVVGEARLAGHPESFQLERGGSRVFVNVPTARHIAVVDRTSMKISGAWPVTTASSNYPMALDEPNHRLFVGCRSPARVLVFDTTSGKQIASFTIVGDTDDLFYDASRKRLYVTGGEGYSDVFQDGGANTFTRLAHVATGSGARTSLFVADQARLYVAVPHRGNQKAEIRVYQAPAASRNEPAVLFVCEHGAAKSVIATAYFNKLAGERRLPYRATFRGTNPQDELSAAAVAGLKAEGVPVPSGKPTAISDADVAGATHIFAIGCPLPDEARRSGKADDWSDVPGDRGYGPMRDAIVRHVTQLLDTLAARRR
jgi:DNA-binding beta-propeller fold protein YncE